MTTPKLQQSTLREKIAAAILSSPTPLKMYDIAHALRLVKKGEAVPANIGAKIRVQLGHLLKSKTIAKEGDKATRRYLPPKAGAKAPKTVKPAPKSKAKKVAKKKPDMKNNAARKAPKKRKKGSKK